MCKPQKKKNYIFAPAAPSACKISSLPMYKILEEAKLFDGKQIGGGPGAKVWGWELHKGNSGGDRNVFYHNCGVIYTIVYICIQTVHICLHSYTQTTHLKSLNFVICKLHFSKAKKFEVKNLTCE